MKFPRPQQLAVAAMSFVYSVALFFGPSLTICVPEGAVVVVGEFVRGRRVVNHNCARNCSRSDDPSILLSPLEYGRVIEAWSFRGVDTVSIHRSRVIEIYLGESHAL